MILESWSELEHTMLLTGTALAAALATAWTWRADRRAGPRSVTRTALFDALDDAVIALDGRDRAIDLNASMERLLDIDASEALGCSLSWLFGRGGLPTDLGRDAVATPVALGDRHYALRIAPLDAEACGPGARMIVLQDVSDRVAAARARRALIDELCDTLEDPPRHSAAPGDGSR